MPDKYQVYCRECNSRMVFVQFSPLAEPPRYGWQCTNCIHTWTRDPRSETANSFLEINMRTGRIRDPGKFEGGYLYVPYFWNCFLEGFHDGDDGNVILFNVEPDDKKWFPELRRRRCVKLIETDQGFIAEV